MSKSPQDTDQAPEGAPDDLMTISAAARAFNVESSAVYFWTKTGALASWRVGLGKGKLLISRAQLERLLEERNRIRPA